MPIVFICSPCKSNTLHSMEDNIEIAKKACEKAISDGYTPFAPHLFYTQFLDNDKEDEREKGISMGLEILERCDEIWVINNYISEGMKREINYAVDHNIFLHFITIN